MKNILAIGISLVLLTAGTALAVKPVKPPPVDYEAMINAETDARIAEDLAQAQTDLSLAQADLAQAQADLALAQADLAQAQADLSQAQVDLSQCSTDLTTSEANYTQCTSDLSQCESDLNLCLNPPEPDKSKEIEKYDSAEKCIEKAHCKIKKGFIDYPNGSFYIGEFLQMFPHGSGYYTLPDGTLVSSQKSNNLPHGKGKFISFNNEAFEGNFILGKHVPDNVTKSQLVQVEKIKSKVTTPAEKRVETEPKVILTQNLETTKTVEYARISVGANIRSDASLTSEIMHTVPPGYPVAVLARQTDWLLVEDYQRRKGWVFASLVKKPKTVIIKVAKGNLRGGPSLKDDVIAQLDHGKIMPVIERKGEWLKVSDFEGLTGWLHFTIIWPSVKINQ